MSCKVTHILRILRGNRNYLAVPISFPSNIQQVLLSYMLPVARNDHFYDLLSKTDSIILKDSIDPHIDRCNFMPSLNRESTNSILNSSSRSIISPNLILIAVYFRIIQNRILQKTKTKQKKPINYSTVNSLYSDHVLLGIHTHTHTYIYIYIYIERERERVLNPVNLELGTIPSRTI